ncbi:HIT finger domain protein, putative [Trichophyton benhamiae CBS 112371]|uniref:HIT finger domain protein, putative n=1 Tax=Arthroderma benhamiae (strain ATCC MYA-4681 / CBS 112371) TaxID=663331 RepID=D4AQ06_ARTBC|nr:HIT finger domain protein, putative [Trichophyton benhamiae CBS 112371]EFE34550.1 HIT finger domain protein, putative [Trichophyton benhamiae CBS 112371]
MDKEIQLAELPLTQLCAICRTCSLACSKRHKLWSQCSGVRDPAEYLKRNELATPAAFDKDFNFLTSIERSLERAEVDAETRGIDLVPNSDPDGGKAKQRGDMARGELPLQRGMENSGVRIVKAPKGMTRNKLNTSHWHRNRLNDEKIAEPPAKKRKVSIEKIVRDGAIDPVEASTVTSCTLEGSVSVEENDDPVPDDVSSSKTLSPGPALPSANESEAPLTPLPVALTPTSPPAPEDNPPTNDDGSSTTLHIYLHRPQTCAKVPVLIPVTDQSMALGAVLRDRTVLEFPTFYVLEHSPDQISGEKYLLEEQYVTQYKDDIDPDGSGEEGEIDEEEESEEAKRLAELNALKVMEVLRRDLEANVASYFE